MKKKKEVGPHKHVWEMTYKYEQRYCYCPGECTCDHDKQYTIAECKICGNVIDADTIETELNK